MCLSRLRLYALDLRQSPRGLQGQAFCAEILSESLGQDLFEAAAERVAPEAGRKSDVRPLFGDAYGLFWSEST